MVPRIWRRQTLSFRRVVFRGPVIWTRQFHPSPPPKAKTNPRMANSTRRRAGDPRRKWPTQEELVQMIVSTETKIPRGMLRDAAKAGVLKNSTIAMEAATHCTVLAYGGAAVSRHTLEEVADLDTIAITGYLITRHPPTAKVGQWMINATAELGVPFSVIALASESLKLTTPGKTQALDMLEELAKMETHPQAMVVHGAVLQKRGKLKEALKFFEKAMEITEPIPSNAFVDFSLAGRIPHPWAAYGALKGQMQERDAAFKALETGAHEYESIEALWLIAQGAGQSKYWDKYVDYMTKLGMSGDPLASFQLGVFYLKQFYDETKRGAHPGVLTRLASFLGLTDSGLRPLAMEWLRIAAHYGHPRSALLIAGLLREDQKLKEGARYLDVAEKHKSCSESAKRMRDCFLDRDAVINLESELPKKAYDVTS